MTTLLVQATSAPLMIDLPWIMPMTEEQFYEFCLANRDLRIERSASGEVIVMPPAFSDTGNRNFNIALQLGSWSELDGTGLGFDSSAGFTLPNGAIRSPDAAWIKLERWNALTEKQKASFAPICPDFVIELMSPSDNIETARKKMQEYLDNGTRLGWLINRKTREVEIYRQGQAVEIFTNPESLSGENILSQFVLELDNIW